LEDALDRRGHHIVNQIGRPLPRKFIPDRSSQTTPEITVKMPRSYVVATAQSL
jgi:hypothetical protein